MSNITDRNCVVFMSDFGLVDSAVSAMHGVADSVSRKLKIEDLTHEIPPFNIWEASYRLIQAVSYWAPGTVFVCVIDPGVGSNRKSVVVKTKSGHFIVTPDNGTLTHVSKKIGIVERREISEKINRLEGSSESYTFHGRDVYAYTGAKLAAGIISFEEVGDLLDNQVVELDFQMPKTKDNSIVGSIDILDIRYGSPWTNIPYSLLTKNGIKYGDTINVTISYQEIIVYGYNVIFGRSFTEVKQGEDLAYINSLLNLAFAINQGSFSKTYQIGTGEGWTVSLNKVN
ncbi:MAG: S-adenosyl-l-methionine hydroxide adenosyltransferase family protein [Spirochaetaceae bacterium]|nr:S-adenosyl-l-methionine hydroxide adenosyltransferase family protein [Spirochaetaceae bacterium]